MKIIILLRYIDEQLCGLCRILIHMYHYTLHIQLQFLKNIYEEYANRLIRIKEVIIYMCIIPFLKTFSVNWK